MTRPPPSETLMRLALAEAEKGRGRTRPNPNVGAVIAHGDTVVTTGFTAPAGGPHAEASALAAAGERARGADIYVTLEPCNHYGRTPPCSEAIIKAGIARVITGVVDPNRDVRGGGIARLQEAGVEVVFGFLAKECEETNRAWKYFIEHHTPWVIAKMAQSLDGRVATRTGKSQWITGEESRALGHKLRDTSDAILVGVGTVLADNPALTTRREGGRDPVRVIVDTHARTPIDAQVVELAKTSTAPTWIAVGERADAARVSALEDHGVKVLHVAERDGHVDLQALAPALAKLDIVSLLVEGGPGMLGGFADAGLINDVVAFIAPMIIGGNTARSTVAGHGIDELTQALRLDDVRIEHAGADIVVRGRVRT